MATRTAVVAVGPGRDELARLVPSSADHTKTTFGGAFGRNSLTVEIKRVRSDVTSRAKRLIERDKELLKRLGD